MEVLRERRISIFLLQVCGALSGGGCGCVRLKIFGSGIKGMVSGYINCVIHRTERTLQIRIVDD